VEGRYVNQEDLDLTVSGPSYLKNISY